MAIKALKYKATLALFLSLVCYSVSAPIGAGFDMDFHLANIWCGWGESQDLCDRSKFKDGEPLAEVPFMFQMCNARPIEMSPTCELEESKPKTQILRTQSGVDQNLYYKIMRVFASNDPVNSVIAMRITNSLITSLVMFMILSLASIRLKFAGLTAFTFTSVPSILLNTTNTSSRSWAVLSVATSWIFLYNFLQTPKDDRRLRQLNLLAFSAVAFLAFATRIDASIMVIMSAVLTLITFFPNRKISSPKPVLIVGFLGLVSFLILQQAPQYQRILSLFTIGLPESYGAVQFLVFQVIHNPEFIADWWGYRIGQSGSGPGIVGIIGLSLFVINIVFALQKSDNKQRVVFLSSTIAIFVMFTKSTIALNSLIPAAGVYTLGFAAPWIGLTILSSKTDSHFMSSVGNRRTALSLIGFANSIVFYSWMEFFTRRGKNIGFYEKLSLNGDWWWNSWLGPDVVFLAGAVLFPVFLVLAWRTIPINLPELPESH